MQGENVHNNTAIWIIAVVALVVGLGGGYYYGYTKGQDDLIAAQKKAAEENIAQKANPFDNTTTNPFEGAYQNPFDTEVNPFQ